MHVYITNRAEFRNAIADYVSGEYSIEPRPFVNGGAITPGTGDTPLVWHDGTVEPFECRHAGTGLLHVHPAELGRNRVVCCTGPDIEALRYLHGAVFGPDQHTLIRTMHAWLPAATVYWVRARLLPVPPPPLVASEAELNHRWRQLEASASPDATECTRADIHVQSTLAPSYLTGLELAALEGGAPMYRGNIVPQPPCHQHHPQPHREEHQQQQPPQPQPPRSDLRPVVVRYTHWTDVPELFGQEPDHHYRYEVPATFGVVLWVYQRNGARWRPVAAEAAAAAAAEAEAAAVARRPPPPSPSQRGAPPSTSPTRATRPPKSAAEPARRNRPARAAAAAEARAATAANVTATARPAKPSAGAAKAAAAAKVEARAGTAAASAREAAAAARPAAARVAAGAEAAAESSSNPMTARG